jgi:signal transduction histidine kinase/ligand-binding sensor domain-containing protein/DNA-binding response OmpR family regulator
MIWVWVATLCHGQSPDLKFEHLNTENGLSQNTITGIVKDKYGFMWFGTWSGLCRYDGYRFKIYRYQQGNPKSIINNRILNISKDADQNLWIVTFNDSVLCKYHYETDNFERIPVKRVSKAFPRQISRNWHLNNAAVSYKGYQWDIGRIQKDLVQTNLATGEVKHYEVNPETRWSLNDPFVTDIYLDDEHILWVGTYSNGINKANLDAKPFRHIDHDPQNHNSIIDNNVHAIAEDKQGNIWVGTRDKGITVISRNHTYQNFQESKNSTNGLSSNFIKTIFCDSRGYVWIGTLRGLDGFDPATGKLRHYTGSGLNNAHVFSAFEDHLHQIWFASWNGIYKYIPAKDSLIRQNTPDLLSKSAMAIMEDSLNQIWVGTEGGGIAVFKPSGRDHLQLVGLLKHSDNQPNSISDDRVYSLCQDAERNIWIGTGNGLDRFDPPSHIFKHFTTSPNGLRNANITGIVEDNNGSVWVSDNRGISKINKRTFRVRNFSTQDGLQGNDFSDGAIFKSRSTDMLYLGGNNGYNAFYPDSIKTDYSVPKVVLTELQVLNKQVGVNDTVNGRVLLQKPLYMTPAISLHYQDKSIAIEFAGLHYVNPSGNKYAYILEGFDKNWIYTDATNRIATYSNLSRGNYVFKVKASNSDGIWNPVPTTLKITVLPPWWASTIAYIFYSLVFIGLLYAFYYYSVRYARLKSKLNYEHLLHEKELEMRQSKIEFFTNISHEIKTPLSLILAPIERLLTEGKDNPRIAGQLQTMKNSGDRLLKLINQLLDIRRFETGNDKLRLQEDDLVSFVKRIVDSFTPLATEKNILLEFNTSVADLTTGFDSDKIEKVLYNLLSNAFKFTPQGGKIDVYLRHIREDLNNYILIDVIDNGSGIPKDELETIFKPFQQASTNKTGGTGLGLAYAKALIELHKGTIHAESTADNAGQNHTCFTVKLPVDLSEALAETITYPSTDGEERHTTSSLDNVFKIDGKAPTLLLVEDNFELRKYLRDYFATEYHVLEAPNGADGLVVANEHTPDLIISDMMMPEMDGLELCRKLKTGVMTSHIPVILLSARTPVEYQIEGIETGADDYMTKPFNLQLLSSKVKNLLTTRMKLLEKYKSGISIQATGIFPESPDDKLLKKVIELVERNIADPELDVESIGNDIGLSRTQLYRKMKALTGLSMGEVIKDIRLKHAQQLLAGKKFNVNEVAYMVGFTDPDYFRKCFKAQFGLTPSDYAKALRTKPY